MSNLAIRIDKLSKLFQLGASGSLRETLTQSLRRLVGKPIPNAAEFWALKDVSFDIQKGEVMGIVGRNGAGKSTLLKILSRISEPTSGKVELYGRITSLLEVGTGFHPELTGRENIFLNGSILGMSQAEIRQKFDEIVAFSGVEKFLDTPVKHYSSGMYVRLAFAVAAHLEAEILVIDEVLAVGDAAFQRKCLGKMNEVAKTGRTVIFVSHNMTAVRTLCTRCCLLQNGQLTDIDTPENIIQKYFFANLDEALQSQRRVAPSKNPNVGVYPTFISVLINQKPGNLMEIGDELDFELDFESRQPTQEIYLSFVISSVQFGEAVHSGSYFLPIANFPTPRSSGKMLIKVGKIPLMSGQYTVTFWVGKTYDFTEHLQDFVAFEVADKDIFERGKAPLPVCPMWWKSDFELIEA